MFDIHILPDKIVSKQKPDIPQSKVLNSGCYYRYFENTEVPKIHNLYGNYEISCNRYE